MYFSDTIKLISTDGTSREVFADIRSAGQNEFFKARQDRMNVECMAIVWAEEFAGERLAEVKGKKLAIYRSYQNGEYMELYFQQKAGIQ